MKVVSQVEHFVWFIFDLYINPRLQKFEDKDISFGLNTAGKPPEKRALYEALLNQLKDSEL